MESQKAQKKLLKSQLKFQRKVHKLETRIAHAISRKDPVVEQQARKDLDELLHSRSEDGCLRHNAPASRSISMHGNQSAAIEEVTNIFRQLLTSIDHQTKQSAQDVLTRKQSQNEKARTLLQHMTKGTQEIGMFRDVTALRGYVRKKFYGRAALIIKSLGEITPKALEMAPRIENVDEQHRLEYLKQRELMGICYDKLSKIQRVCSIGCGPGNDVVGLIAFLRSLSSDETESAPPNNLQQVKLLDFAIEEWEEAALNALIPILQPQYVEQITCASCDVTKPLFTTSEAAQSISSFVQSTDIFLTSYLLSETRNTWDLFFVQLVQLAPVGALFYFSEPMAWQLHRFIRISTPDSTTGCSGNEKESHVANLRPLHRLKFLWIDSSMHHPEMQQMEGRAGGPAVLLAIKL